MLKTCCKLHANPSSKYSIVQFVQDWAFRVNHWISLLSPVCALNQAVLNMVNSHSLDLQSIVGVYPCPWTLSKVWWFQDIIFNLHTQEMSTFYPEWFYITKVSWRNRSITDNAMFLSCLQIEISQKAAVRICCLYLVHVCGADFLYLPKFNISFLCWASISCFAGQENGNIFNKPNKLYSYRYDE